MRRSVLACVLLACLVIACRDAAVSPTVLSHEAYVWQRQWTPAVTEAVARPPAAIRTLRVLAREVARDGTAATPTVDADALADSGRPVVAVMRLDGSRPIADLPLAPLLDVVADWRAAGVDVWGVEIDHDCATVALPDYVAWLARVRPDNGLRLSITALPSWAGSPHLRALADSVDELVVQVHAVRAPRLFEPGEARAWLRDFSTAIGGRAFRVALPTYRVAIDGAVLSADAAELSAFVAGLERRPVPGLRGVVWFRLPVAGDDRAWSAATLGAVIRGERLAAQVSAHLLERETGAFDVVLENRGTVSAPWPNLRLAGGVNDADLVAGYAATRAHHWRAPRAQLAPGQRVVVGWATGQEMTIDAH